MPDGTAARCNVCGAEGFSVIHRSRSERSLTSTCRLRPGGVEVSFCGACGHIGSRPFADVETFYESDYRILIASEDEDQIYETRGEHIVYRSDHQMAVLADKLPIVRGMRVLDYGCAKAEMSKRLKAAHPDLDIHLYDVSHSYKDFWDRLVPADRQAIHETPVEWAGRFDVVTSYFAFEHIPDPASAARHVASLLRPGGTLYAIVPDTFGNIADFIVADHVNHFTRSSLLRLLSDAGFTAIDIDAEAHRGAFVVVARKSGEPARYAPEAEEIAETERRARALATYWGEAENRLRAQETGPTRQAAIYGAGFYGAFIYAHLRRPERVTCFVDRNPHLAGRALFDLPIVKPDALPEETDTLFVGLNPAIAREAMAASPLAGRAGLSARFLDGGR